MEHLGLAVAVAAVIAAVTLSPTALPERVAALLGGDSPTAPQARTALTAAVRGTPGAPSPLGARTWLAEAVGPAAADREVHRAVEQLLRERHPAWLRDTAVGEIAIEASATQQAGRIVVRVVGHHEEQRHAERTTTPGERIRAGVLALLIDGATTLAHRLSRPFGLMVSGLRLIAAPAAPDPLPPGSRAGDLIACRPVLVTRHVPLRGQSSLTAPGWRIVILREGRVVADALSADDRACRAPAP